MTAGLRIAAVLAAAVTAGAAAGEAGAAQMTVPPPGMVRIRAGSYLPLYAAASPVRDGQRTRVPIGGFDIDVHAVTNAEYLAFVRAHPQWQRSRVRPVLADRGYLRHWAGDLELGGNAPPDSPVVNVSWFAARAYLHSLGKELPTIGQWEYVAAASATKRDASRDRAFLERVREWYGRPVPDRLPAVGAGTRNVYGVTGLHGLVWEWTLDFNSALITGDSRADSSPDRSLVCGGGAAGANDVDDYAAFMRYAFRSSLEASYTVANLGFRGVAAHQERR